MKILKEVKLNLKSTVPKFYVENFRNKLSIEEIKDELMNSMDMEVEKKMTPQKIKEELDRFVIGQDHVKKSIAIALSNFLF